MLCCTQRESLSPHLLTIGCLVSPHGRASLDISTRQFDANSATPSRSHRTNTNSSPGMERTRKNLKAALVKSAESKYFLPEDGLNGILTAETIRACIEEAGIDIVLKRNCVEAVFDGGKKLLALLIMLNRVDLLVKFVETDHSSKSGHLDSRLPFE